jgi:predicted ATP-binding protein involved in virulence
MRIKQISVYGLFDLFDHKIVLKEKEHITIIHSPNGFGKTFILRMIDHFFHGDISFFKDIPFSRFNILFEDNREISINKTSMNGQETKFSISINNDGLNTFSILEVSNNKIFRKWLNEKSLVLRTRLVKTQRLEIYERTETDIQLATLRLPRTSLTVEKYSRDLAQKIQEALRSYAASAEELDRTFPMRLLQYKPNEPAKADTLTKKLEELEEKRTKLTTLGFLDPEKNNSSLSAKDVASKLDVFSVYVEDTEKKLQVFDEMADKISLLMEIVEKRFLYKKLSIHRDRGLEVTTRDGKLLELAKLSSGEQQELVLLYEMLFQVPAGSLLLIDEPEISLHVAWQMQFLSDLERIVKLADFDLILATHSPQIINDRWDLTVELKGPEL